MIASSSTRYARVAQALLAEISGGRYPVGSRLPTEAELETRFRVSRHTVRAAIRHLRELGLVTARAGVGTTVRAQSAPEKVVLSMNSVEELLRFTRDTRLHLVAHAPVTADARLAGMLGGRAGESWVRLDTVRVLTKTRQPIGGISTWLHPEFAGVTEDVDASAHSLITLVERRFGVKLAELQQEISPAVMPRELARRLNVKPGTPALRILRHYYDAGGNVLQVSVGHYPEGRFSYKTRMRVAAS